MIVQITANSFMNEPIILVESWMNVLGLLVIVGNVSLVSDVAHGPLVLQTFCCWSNCHFFQCLTIKSIYIYILSYLCPMWLGLTWSHPWKSWIVRIYGPVVWGSDISSLLFKKQRTKMGYLLFDNNYFQ